MGFCVERENARVMWYTAETVVQLLALSWEFKRDKATALNLLPDVLLDLAAKHARETMPTEPAPCGPVNPVLIAEDEISRKMVRLWCDPTKGLLLRELVRVMEA